jgi:hypothetical protein
MPGSGSDHLRVSRRGSQQGPRVPTRVATKGLSVPRSSRAKRKEPGFWPGCKNGGEGQI